jgi:hypothetical protein
MLWTLQLAPDVPGIIAMDTEPSAVAVTGVFSE